MTPAVVAPRATVSSEEEAQRLVEGAPGADTPQSVLSRLARGVRILLYVGLYLFCGPTLILVNNKILRGKKADAFPYPMLLSGLGLSVTAIVSVLLVRTGCVKLEHRDVVTWPFFAYNLLPVGAALATTYATGNAVYLYLNVGFIQMLKAFTPATTLAVLWMSGIEVPSWRVLVSVLAISVGTAITSVGEGSLHPLGLLLMLSAEVAEAIRLALTQKLLQNLKFGVVEGQYHLAPVTALWLFGVASVYELPHFLRHEAWRVPLAHPLAFASSALLGFFVAFCSFLVIKATNSVTLKVLGLARSAGLIVWSALVMHETITRLELGGYSLSLLAFVAYNYFRVNKL